MTRFVPLFLCFLLIAPQSHGEAVKDFIKDCGYGTLIGALAGVVTLAFEKNPNEHGNNVARGASLGLYGGIAYGLYDINHPQAAAAPLVFNIDPSRREYSLVFLKSF